MTCIPMNGSCLAMRQVQCMFRVDRSRVYQMTMNGGLPALKIG